MSNVMHCEYGQINLWQISVVGWIVQEHDVIDDRGRIVWGNMSHNPVYAIFNTISIMKVTNIGI